MEVEGAIWDGAESKRSVPCESSETLESPLEKKNVEEGTSSVFSLLSSLKCLGTSNALKALYSMLFGYPKMKLYLS